MIRLGTLTLGEGQQPAINPIGTYEQDLMSSPLPALNRGTPVTVPSRRSELGVRLHSGPEPAQNGSKKAQSSVLAKKCAARLFCKTKLPQRSRCTGMRGCERKAIE